MNEVGKNDALIAEYKEMRDEIRAAWTQYYSTLVGIGLTGIASILYLAFERKEWLFMTIPLLTVSYIAYITTIKANIKHISNYIEKLEKAIGSPKVMFYESKYAKKLWESAPFMWLHILIIIPLIAIQFYSIYRGCLFLVKCCINYTERFFLVKAILISTGYAIGMLTLTGLALYLLIFLPKKVSERVYDVEKANNK